MQFPDLSAKRIARTLPGAIDQAKATASMSSGSRIRVTKLLLTPQTASLDLIGTNHPATRRSA
jgi:hypothetical protein